MRIGVEGRRDEERKRACLAGVDKPISDIMIIFATEENKRTTTIETGGFRYFTILSISTFEKFFGR